MRLLEGTRGDPTENMRKITDFNIILSSIVLFLAACRTLRILFKLFTTFLLHFFNNSGSNVLIH